MPTATRPETGPARADRKNRVKTVDGQPGIASAIGAQVGRHPDVNSDFDGDIERDQE